MASGCSKLRNPTLVLAYASVEDTLSRWHCNKDEGNEKLCTDSLSFAKSQESNHYDEYKLWRVFYCKENDVKEYELEALRSFAIEEGTYNEPVGQTDSSNLRIEVRGLAFGAWQQLNRNVPSHLRFTNSGQVPRFVAVARRKPPWRGPIVVLVGLKYGGNVGAIIRSAVQANVFQAVYIVEERGTRTETSPLFTKTWGVSETGKNKEEVKDKYLSDKDISYYSMWNAPLIEIRRFQTVDQFLKAADEDSGNYSNCCRATVCLDTGRESFSLYSKDAIGLFQSHAGKVMYLVIGAEDTGIPQTIIDCATALVEIPAMSASINVSSAFTACLSTFVLCNSGALDT